MTKMEFTCDEDGKELLLKDGKFQVMMEWERPYMEACIDALASTGDVLEIGFGCGYASTHIQRYKPRSHTIIEYHPVVAAKAREWAKEYANITIIEDTWQNAIEKLGQFDAIFFDDYPLESEQEGKRIEEKKQEAHAVLASGEKLLNEIHQQLPTLKTQKYTENEIDLLEGDPVMISRFISDLYKNGQIDDAVLSYARKRFSLPEQVEEAPLFRHQGDRLFKFLQLCLKAHMRPGAVFSCYLEDPTSKFEDDTFFNAIITNPYLEYAERLIQVEVPAHCNYYRGNEALVITIRKV